MKSLSIVLAALVMMSAQTFAGEPMMALPDCAEARVSNEAKYAALLQIDVQAKAIGAEVDALTARAEKIVSDYQSGRITQSQALNLMEAVKTEAADLQARNQELQNLVTCISK